MLSQTNHSVSLVSDSFVSAGDENTVRKMLMHAKLATEGQVDSHTIDNFLRQLGLKLLCACRR